MQSHDNEGWSDPTVIAKYRLIEDTLLLDLFGGAIVESGDAWEGTNGDRNAKGSNGFDLTGGPAFLFGAEIGKKTESSQYSFLAQFKRNGEAKIHDGDVDTLESHNSYLMSARMLNTIADKLFLRSQLSAMFLDARYLKSDDGTPERKASPVTEYRLGTEALYALTPEVMGNIGITYRQLNFLSGLFEDYHVWLFTLGARYQY